MTILTRQSMRIGLLIGLILVLVTTSSLATENDIKVPFLFTEDEKLPQTDLRATVPHSTALSAEHFLSAPMTRLEYMLTRLEAELNAESNRSLIREQLAKGFEPDW